VSKIDPAITARIYFFIKTREIRLETYLFLLPSAFCLLPSAFFIPIYGITDLKREKNGKGIASSQTSGTSNSLHGVYFINANTGWAVGTNGTVRKKVNGGTTWSNQSTGTTQWNSVYFASPATGWITGNSGAVRKTTDGALHQLVNSVNILSSTC